MTSISINDPFVFVDVETTGTSIYHDRVIELGLIRVENGREVGRYQTLLDPDTALSPYIEQMTGITRAMLDQAPLFSTVVDEVAELLHGAIFVAHNVRFDYAFMKTELARLGRAFSPQQLCTVRLARKLYPDMRRHNLDAIIERFGISCPNRHRAFDDAHVLWEFFQRVREEFTPAELELRLGDLTRRPGLPAKLAHLKLSDLPESAGVYIFRGAKNYPLYVGKSVNLRDRIMSHFTDDTQTTRHLEMCQQVEAIETHQTGGELAALLLESQLVKELQPLYNRFLRRKREMVIVRQEEDEVGYLRASFERVDEIDPATVGTIIGIFESERRMKTALAEIAVKHSLCHKLLGMEKLRGACFASQLGTCLGACTNSELAVRYNLRFATAFHHNKIRPWISAGPVWIEERDPRNGRRDRFLVDQWCLLRHEYWLQDDDAASGAARQPQFDLDTYRILARYLLNNRNHASITPAPLSVVS